LQHLGHSPLPRPQITEAIEMASTPVQKPKLKIASIPTIEVAVHLGVEVDVQLANRAQTLGTYTRSSPF
jgi:hypothetical protein